MPIGPQGERLPYPGEPGYQGASPAMPRMGGGMPPQMPRQNPAVTDLETIRKMKDAEIAKLMGKPLHRAFDSTPPMTPPQTPPPQMQQQMPPQQAQQPPQQGQPNIPPALMQVLQQQQQQQQQPPAPPQPPMMG